MASASGRDFRSCRTSRPSPPPLSSWPFALPLPYPHTPTLPYLFLFALPPSPFGLLPARPFWPSSRAFRCLSLPHAQPPVYQRHVAPPRGKLPHIFPPAPRSSLSSTRGPSLDPVTFPFHTHFFPIPLSLPSRGPRGTRKFLRVYRDGIGCRTEGRTPDEGTCRLAAACECGPCYPIRWGLQLPDRNEELVLHGDGGLDATHVPGT